jgi:hypothetical protein
LPGLAGTEVVILRSPKAAEQWLRDNAKKIHHGGHGEETTL